MKQPESSRVEPQEGGHAAGFATAVWELTERLARWTGHQVMRPRARTLIVGVVLILVAVLFVAHSFWTAPLVIVGIVMILVAWVGSRLEGRFAIEWSELGTGFEMHARFKSMNATPNELTAAPTPAPAPDHLGHASHDDDDDVIEGEAHTMEIPAEELRALVAALEQIAPQAHAQDHRDDSDAGSADAVSHTTAPSLSHLKATTQAKASSNGKATAAHPSTDED